MDIYRGCIWDRGVDMRANILFVICLFFTGYVSFDALENMVTLWITTDTYMHGAFVIPLAIMMAYQKALPSHDIKPLSIGLSLLLCMVWGCALVLASLSMINVLVQGVVLSLFTLISIICFGWRITWHYKTPLLLVFLSVPVGDFLIPYLQSITADMAVFLLNISDVSVLRNGWYISIAQADFRVAEACSGVNFLISTFTVAVFYAFTYMDRPVKRAVFIALGLIVPLVANGLRVYMIIMIAHFGNVEAATGVDHLVYGWIFFMFILVLLFIIGYFMKDPLAEGKGVFLSSIKDVRIKFSTYPMIALTLVLTVIMMFLTSMPNSSQVVGERHEAYIKDALGPIFPYSDDQCKTNSDGISHYTFTYNDESTLKKLINVENRWFNDNIWSIDGFKKVYIGDSLPAIEYDLIDLSGNKSTLVISYEIGGEWAVSKLSVKKEQVISKLLQRDFGGKAHGWFSLGDLDLKSIQVTQPGVGCEF